MAARGRIGDAALKYQFYGKAALPERTADRVTAELAQVRRLDGLATKTDQVQIEAKLIERGAFYALVGAVKRAFQRAIFEPGHMENQAQMRARSLQAADPFARKRRFLGWSAQTGRQEKSPPQDWTTPRDALRVQPDEISLSRLAYQLGVCSGCGPKSVEDSRAGRYQIDGTVQMRSDTPLSLPPFE